MTQFAIQRPTTSEPWVLDQWFDKVARFTRAITTSKSITASYTVEAEVYWIVANATSGNITVTLPGTGNYGRPIGCIKSDSSANTVTISAAGTDLINGSATQTLSSQYDAMALRDNGTSWDIEQSTSLTHMSGVLPVASGGTNISSYAVGDLIYASAATTLSTLADVATGNALISGGVTTAPSWGKIGLTTHVNGTLPIANGGTNSSTALSGNTIIISNGTQIVQGTAGTTTTVLHGNAAGSPTYSAVSLTADITGTLAETHGGTNQATYATGDTLYSSASNTLAKLSGNITTTRKFLRQTGNGSVSAAPAWDTLLAADVPASALTKGDDTNVTLTLGGSPTTALLAAASITAGWTGQLGLTRGGTAASLVASTGGIVYSAASALAILSGTATAGQIVRSGASAAPTWSTATYPATGGSSGNVLRSDGTNFLSAQLASGDLSDGISKAQAAARVSMRL